MNTTASRIELSVANSEKLLKVKCHDCRQFFTNKDINEDNYVFIANYDNRTCFGTEIEHNKLEKKGDKYFLSLEVCRIEHKQHYS